MERLRLSMTIAETAQALIATGGDLFGQEGIAYEASCEFQDMVEPGEKPIVVAWDVFLQLLEAHGKVVASFEAAWPRKGVIPFAISRGLQLADAQDVNQLTMMSVWRNFLNYQPWKAAWSTWILHAATNHINRRLSVWYEPQFLDPYPDQLLESNAEQESMVVDDRGWAVPIIIEEWRQRGDQRYVKFAEMLLAVYHNLDWIAPTGNAMAAHVGVSRSFCYKLFREFAEEVIERESNC